MRGPVNIFRPEYGRWWLIDKTGDEHFERKLGIAARGEYAYYEALNLANGKRSVAEIRDVFSAEFEPIPAAEVLQFFKFMEERRRDSDGSSEVTDAGRRNAEKREQDSRVIQSMAETLRRAR